jgi:putative oxidoreductase
MQRLRALGTTLGRASIPLLRISLGVVFIWFGALKFSSSTPVGELVAKTLPFLPSHVLVPALGAFEVLLGIGLLIGRRLEIVALLMCAHLAGTFLVLVTQPSVAFQDGNPFMLTMTGEFVVKNVVLITAGLVVATLRPVRPLALDLESSDLNRGLTNSTEVVGAELAEPAPEAALG